MKTNFSQRGVTKQSMNNYDKSLYNHIKLKNRNKHDLFSWPIRLNVLKIHEIHLKSALIRSTEIWEEKFTEW